MNNRWDDIGSSIFFVDCSHKSIEKSSLLPLVSLTPSRNTHAGHTDTVQKVASTLVSCSGLSLCDTHLSIGSGPLVGFSSSTEQDSRFSKKLESVLIGSRLVNMTSGDGKGALKGWSGCQTILGSIVTRSTNHLYGTACIDMNLGGSLLCSNTSFSHCHSSLKPEFIENKTYTLQHKTKQERLYFNKLITAPIIFTRCTFSSMKSQSDGAGIRLSYTPSELTVSECSFSNCRAYSSGGAISIWQSSSEPTPFSISSSLFVECSTWSGGAIHCMRTTTDTITDSVFRNNEATYNGGALNASCIGVAGKTWAGS